jgi:hypothetical protein
MEPDLGVDLLFSFSLSRFHTMQLEFSLDIQYLCRIVLYVTHEPVMHHYSYVNKIK